ncbi:hypothetical protein [Nonomuraea sp. 10N515B]|uniref:hypothetical protein n=1 Tax=Nonomuraea sp. 10N515B TaxID=3457422 RepID=UPI003FCD1E5A
MTDTTTERAALTAGPAAYRVAATQLNADDGPYLVLECTHEHDHDACTPGRCISNLLHGTRYRTGVDLGTLLQAAINHYHCHTGTMPCELAEQLREQIAELGAYRLCPDMDVHPFLVLNCPYLERETARLCPDTVDGECLANLLPEDQNTGSVELGTLLRLAAEHELARARALAERLGAESLEARAAELTAQHIALAGVAAGREVEDARRKQQAAEEHAAELLARLAALRRAWAERQRAEIYARETSDGVSAFIASESADLIGRFLADLDRAANGG